MMLAKLLPLGLAAAGAGIGVGVGVLLAPDPEPVAQAGPGADAAGAPAAVPAASGEAAPHSATAEGGHGEAGAQGTYVRFDQQFIVPVLSGGRVDSMVVLGLTLDVVPDAEEPARARQPRLRDRFLRVMLDHANTGGFSGAFTANGAVDRLRNDLLAAGRAEIGPGLNDVLILDINRRDV